MNNLALTSTMDWFNKQIDYELSRKKKLAKYNDK